MKSSLDLERNLNKLIMKKGIDKTNQRSQQKQSSEERSKPVFSSIEERSWFSSRNYGLLSFGNEAEEDEEEITQISMVGMKIDSIEGKSIFLFETESKTKRNGKKRPWLGQRCNVEQTNGRFAFARRREVWKIEKFECWQRSIGSNSRKTFDGQIFDTGKIEETQIRCRRWRRRRSRSFSVNIFDTKHVRRVLFSFSRRKNLQDEIKKLKKELKQSKKVSSNEKEEQNEKEEGSSCRKKVFLLNRSFSSIQKSICIKSRVTLQLRRTRPFWSTNWWPELDVKQWNITQVIRHLERVK